jgi:hypothetical protein
MHTHALELAHVRKRLLEELPPIPGRLADPASQPTGIPGVERPLELLDATPVLGESRAKLTRVVHEDVDPDARVRAGNARHVAQRAPGCRQRLVPVDTQRPGVVEHDVGKRVWKVARQRQKPVMGLGIDGHRDSAQRGHEPVQQPVTLGLRLGDGSEEPRRSLEELGAGVARPPSFRTANRMAADEA